MFKFLESLDQKRFFKIFCSPIWWLVEYICYRKYWYNDVLIELTENQEILDFLDKNEFGYVKGRFIKKDLLDGMDFYDGKPLDEIRIIIKKEFVESFTKVITDNSIFDIQDFISLTVKTELRLNKDDGEVHRNKVFEVNIQYCRYWWVCKAAKYSRIWLAVVTVLIGISLLLLQ